MITLDAQLEAANLPRPEQEYQFHPTRKWRFDYAWPSWKIALEVEGAVYAQGRHTRGAGFEADCLKYAEAVLLGWRVLRFSTGQVEDGTAVKYLSRLFELAMLGDYNESEI